MRATNPADMTAEALKMTDPGGHVSATGRVPLSGYPLTEPDAAGGADGRAHGRLPY